MPKEMETNDTQLKEALQKIGIKNLSKSEIQALDLGKLAVFHKLSEE